MEGSEAEIVELQLTGFQASEGKISKREQFQLEFFNHKTWKEDIVIQWEQYHSFYLLVAFS